MADNINITPGTGKVIATDEETGTLAHIQKVKLAYSGDGIGTLIPADGDGLSVNEKNSGDVLTALQLIDNAVGGNYLNTNINIAGTDVGIGEASIPIKDGGNSITVDGTVAVIVSNASGTALNLTNVDETTVSEKISSLNYRELTIYWSISSITGRWRLMVRVYDPDDTDFYIILNSADYTSTGSTRIQYPIHDTSFDIRLLRLDPGNITCTVKYLLKS